MINPKSVKPIEILLVEDNPGDIRLTIEALKDGKLANNLTVVQDGVEAIALLHREGPYAKARRPDIILLDLNLPKLHGSEILSKLKTDERFKSIPVIILTTSKADEDILRSYQLHANCYISKPVDLDEFVRVVRSIEDFWLSIIKLPPSENYV
jgi:two-component system, chemotaxis family, response regulator Rcp1